MRRVAALLATLCLNFAFWHDNGSALRLPFSKAVTALVVPLIAAAIAALFFAGPALAVHRNGSGLFAAVESALGLTLAGRKLQTALRHCYHPS